MPNATVEVTEYNRQVRENCPLQCGMRFRDVSVSRTSWRCFTCGSVWDASDDGNPVDTGEKVAKPNVRVGIAPDYSISVKVSG